MHEREVPASPVAQEKIKRSQRRICIFLNILFDVFAALAVLCLIGLVVIVIAFEFNDTWSDVLFYILLGCFLGGCVLGLCGAMLFGWRMRLADAAAMDFAERCDSPESFYVGEGTLATFTEDGLELHGEETARRIRIPYAEIRLYSVCSRRAPREKGEWSVIIGIPARYLARDERSVGSELIYVQTDYKERLIAAIAAHGLTLLGEQREGDGRGKFTLKAKYFQPIPKLRRRGIILLVIGCIVICAGVALSFLQPSVGVTIATLGVFVATRGWLTFVGAKTAVLVYEEGIFYRDGGVRASESESRMFLKWEEIDSLSQESVQGTDVIKVQCPYGDYHLPDIGDLYQYLKELHPAICK